MGSFANRLIRLETTYNTKKNAVCTHFASMPKQQKKTKNCNSTANYHGSNTVFLVGVLMSVVGGVFVTFALMALCYRSVVVHNNFSLCLRLVIFFVFFPSDFSYTFLTSLPYNYYQQLTSKQTNKQTTNNYSNNNNKLTYHNQYNSLQILPKCKQKATQCEH